MTSKYVIWLFCLPLFVTSLTDAVAQDRLSGLFDTDEILELRLEGNLRALMRDRGEDPSYHKMKLHYRSNNSGKEPLNLRVRVRGNFRRLRENCKNPPLKFNFEKNQVPDSSLFVNHEKLKVVVPCAGEEYVLREYLTYKLYNLFTDYSFRVRLIRLAYHDTRKNKVSEPEYGFLIEDEDDMATRNGGSLYEKNNLRPETIDEESFLRMSVFAYMIGNTDWSIQFRHNTKLLFLEDQSIFVAVPYDFDLVGIVSSPYAKPAEALKLKSVRERVYRGYCLEDISRLEPIFEQFRDLKGSIYAMYAENKLLEDKYIKSTHEYLDEFYDVLEDPDEAAKVFTYPCNESGTGNVVISGMQNDH